MTAKPLTDQRRQTVLDELVDVSTLLNNVTVIRSQGGRNLIDLMREATASQIRAANYEGSSGGGGGSEIPDPTYRAFEAGDADDVERARATVLSFDVHLERALAELEAAWSDAVSFLPRPARPKEAETSALEEANADAGCQSCARIRLPSGSKLWGKTWRTGRVASKPKGADAAQGDKGRKRRALMTSEADAAALLARLDDDYRLCRGCYEQVERAVYPGAQLSLGRALPLAKLRTRLEAASRKAAS